MAGSVVRVSARCVDASKCPFAEDAVSFELGPGDVVWLQGPSGVGKSTIAAEVAGLGARRGALEKSLGVSVAVDWAAGVPVAERCGAMFQQTTLVDALSVGGNVRCALWAAREAEDHVVVAKRLVEAVGLDWARDGRKMPQELSGAWRGARRSPCSSRSGSASSSWTSPSRASTRRAPGPSPASSGPCGSATAPRSCS